MRRIDAKLLKILNRSRTEKILPDARDHEDLGAAQARGDGLIRALAAEPEVEFLTEDSFARLWKTIGEGGEIDISAADHHDSWNLRHQNTRAIECLRECMCTLFSLSMNRFKIRLCTLQTKRFISSLPEEEQLTSASPARF